MTEEETLDPSVAIRAFEEAEVELRRVAGLAEEAFAEYEKARADLAGVGIEVKMKMPAPLDAGYVDWDRDRARGRVIGLAVEHEPIASRKA